jgi:hypothetical protein
METGQAARGATMPGKPVTDAAVDDVVSHQAFFYHGQRDYVAQIKAFADAGLASGEPVIIAVPGQRESTLRDHLGEHVCYADMTRLGRNPARIIGAVREFIDAYPGQRVRYAGEPAWPA